MKYHHGNDEGRKRIQLGNKRLPSLERLNATRDTHNAHPTSGDGIREFFKLYRKLKKKG